MNRIRLFLLSGVLLMAVVATVGCGGEPTGAPFKKVTVVVTATPTVAVLPNQETGAIRRQVVNFPRHNDPLITDRGWRYLFGVLELTDGCLRVRLFPDPNAMIGDPDSYLMLWPANFSVNDEDGDVRVIDGNGLITARVGDTLRVSGGRWYKEDVPQELLSSIPEICRGYGYYWKVGDEVSALGPDEPLTITIPGSTIYFPRSKTRIGGGGSGIALKVAGVEGVLSLRDDCLRIVGEYDYIIVWPPGFAPHIEDGVVEVHNGGGKTIARVGDYLVIGGGEAGEARSTDGLIPCVGTYWDDTNISSITRNGQEVYSQQRGK